MIAGQAGVARDLAGYDSPGQALKICQQMPVVGGRTALTSIQPVLCRLVDRIQSFDDSLEDSCHSRCCPVDCRLLEGGADTGFHHVVPEKYTPRLFHFHGTGKNIVVTQVKAVS